MKLHTLKRFEFSAARQIDGRLRGDNYSGWLGVSGPFDPVTGMIINLADLKSILTDALEQFDHRYLNTSLNPIEPTTPNVAQVLYDVARSRLPAGIHVDSLELLEEDGDGALVTTDRPAYSIARGGFSAAHRTHAPRLTDRENRALYGKCDNPQGHGHNYRAEVYLPADHGIAPDLWDEFDHVNLSTDIPELRNRNVVTEAIAALIAQRAPQSQRVRARVRVWETPDFFAEVRAGDEVYRLGRRYRFHAAHRLHSPALSDDRNRAVYGKCNRPDPHGHTYQVQVTVAAPLDPRTETAFDIGCLDRHAHEILRGLDFTHLDRDVAFFKERPSTGENVAAYVWSQFAERLPDVLNTVQVWETPNNQFVATAG
jgi:6-pyruvoyltetrahydropterin/6-carboxytetrahydropterin synthase